MVFRFSCIFLLIVDWFGGHTPTLLSVLMPHSLPRRPYVIPWQKSSTLSTKVNLVLLVMLLMNFQDFFNGICLFSPNKTLTVMSKGKLYGRWMPRACLCLDLITEKVTWENPTISCVLGIPEIETDYKQITNRREIVCVAFALAHKIPSPDFSQPFSSHTAFLTGLHIPATWDPFNP